MKSKDRLDKLFTLARSEKPILKSDQVERIVKSGKKVSAKKIKLGTSGRGLFNPLNLIIMISTIAIITSLFFIFNSTTEIPQEGHQIPVPTRIKARSSQKQEIAKESVPGSSPGQAIPAEAGTSSQTTVITNTNLPDNNIPIVSDTVIRGQILKLSKEELSRLGFEFDINGYYYLNELPDKSKINLWSYSEKGKGSSLGFGRGGYVNPVIKIDPTKKDYYPVCTSSLNGDDIRKMVGLPDDFIDRFEYYNDTLVPVILSWSELGGKMSNNRLAWFKVNRDFYIDLGPSFEYLYESYIEVKEKSCMVIYDYSYSQLNIGKAIYLDHSLISSMGFNLTADSLVYRYGTSVEFWFTSSGRGLESISNPAIKDDEKDGNKPFLIAISNLLLKTTMNVVPSAFYQVDSTITGSNWIDICVPVKFTNSTGQLWDGSTFWFYPNTNFFECLPDSIGGPMREEFSVNVAPKIQINYRYTAATIVGVRAPDSIYNKIANEEPVPCQYFPTFCEGLPGLDNLNVYPNPATDMLNAEVTISRGKSIDYRVFDISGRLMIDEVETQKYKDAGMYRQQIDLSSLEEGFYLLVLTDDEGAKMTRRIIKN